MARGVVRGKALVAKLRANPEVRDAEALAAHLGRYRKLRKAGRSVEEATKALKEAAGSSSGPKKSADSLVDRVRNGASPKPKKRGSVLAKKPDLSDDDPFAEDFGEDEPKSKEDRQRELLEARLIRDMERADRRKVYRAIQDQGGLKTRDDLREEYAGIPNTYKRRDGLPGDEMADHLARYYPELGIESENDLIDYLAA